MRFALDLKVVFSCKQFHLNPVKLVLHKPFGNFCWLQLLNQLMKPNKYLIDILLELKGKFSKFCCFNHLEGWRFLEFGKLDR